MSATVEHGWPQAGPDLVAPRVDLVLRARQAGSVAAVKPGQAILLPYPQQPGPWLFSGVFDRVDGLPVAEFLAAPGDERNLWLRRDQLASCGYAVAWPEWAEGGAA